MKKVFVTSPNYQHKFVSDYRVKLQGDGKEKTEADKISKFFDCYQPNRNV